LAVDLASGDQVQLILTGSIDTAMSGDVVNTGTVLSSGGVIDPDDPSNIGTGNNSDSVTFTYEILTQNLGVATNLETIVNNLDGTYTITMSYWLENFGTDALTSVVLTHNLDNGFNGMSPTSLSVSGSDFATNGSWDGSSGTSLLAAGQTLVPGATGVVYATFTVTP
jgi:hypothetical protein